MDIHYSWTETFRLEKCALNLDDDGNHRFKALSDAIFMVARDMTLQS